MSAEIELKFELPSEALRNLMHSASLRGLASGKPRERELTSTYFDTAKRKLRRHGLTLRVREVGDRHIQTIKTAESGQAFGRGEWETDIAGSDPDLRAARKTGLAAFGSSKLAGKLEPLFSTRVTRLTAPVHRAKAEVEVAIDLGEVRANMAHEPIAEIEFELKSGKASELPALVRELLGELPAALSFESKSERGYALADGKDKRSVDAGPITLKKSLSVEDGFKLIGISCLRHIVSNKAAVAAADPEGIHQMRVGLRRLRAAISVFKEIVADAQIESIKGELKWLTEQLGSARDLEVLLSESIVPAQQDNETELEALGNDVQNRLDAGFETARIALDSDRFRKLVNETAFWILSGPWQQTDKNASSSLHVFAKKQLRKRHKKISRQIKDVASLEPAERHKLRIAVKKLRYALNFFDTLFDEKAAKKELAAVLKALQTALGRLNDFHVHEGLAEDIMREPCEAPAQPQKSFGMGLILGAEKKEHAAFLALAERSGKKLARARTFW